MMSDISMCAASACPVAETCRRSPASGTQPDPLRQAWSAFQPAKGADCYGYWPTEARDE